MRYRSEPSKVERVSGSSVRLASAEFTPAPGQSAVLYAADGECLGGGEIVSWRSG
jgi:tRNA U34 2-thiouridine synthase MnmA/TrmU